MSTRLGEKNRDDKMETIWILKSEKERKNVKKFCEKNGLKVKKGVDNLHLRVRGKTRDYSKVVDTTIHEFKDKDGKKYHQPYSSKNKNAHISKLVKIPKGVSNIIGLDNQPKFRPYFTVKKNDGVAPRVSSSFTPLQLAQLYSFPAGTGLGQKIGLIELGGGILISDVQKYFTTLGITTSPNITLVSVGGAQNNPADTNASVEVILDVEIIASLVPLAETRVYFAANSDIGFYNAINQAINDGCKIISISWGAAEIFWSTTTLNSFNNLFSSAASKGVSIFSSSGDSGSSDSAAGNNVDFPGSCPFGVSCGGTRLTANGNTIVSEVVWNNNSTTSATGGGLSKVFATPSYQANLPITAGKRAVPDISANADPQTGYIIYGQGQTMVVGGTSCVSPLFSALTARINQNIGRSIGFIQPTLYANGSSVCRDITNGNNGAYSASTNFDLASGWGCPIGRNFLNLFAGTTVPPSPVIPVADFSANVVSGVSPLVVQFTNASTNATTYLYNFGDNQTSTLANPSHTYTTAGTYTVTLTATNTAGNNTKTKTNYITVSTPSVPTSSFSLGNISVRFQNTSTGATSYLWSFGDGTTSTLASPTHLYRNPGVYTVSLTSRTSSQTKVSSRTITLQ